MIEKKSGKLRKRNLTKSRSMKVRPLLLNPERKYKYLCEEGSAAMLMLSEDGKVIDANNAVLELSGYLRDEIVDKNVLDFVVPEHRQKAAAQIQMALSKGTAPQFEVAFRSKDGSTRTLLLPPKQLVLEEEGQRSFLVMGVDITERGKYEARLLGLHTHASQLSSAEGIDTIVKCTLDAMEVTLGFDHAYFLSVENDSLQIKGSRGGPAVFSAQPLGGRGTTVKAANTRTTLRISDTRKEPAFVDPKGYEWTGSPTVLSELVVPVLVDAEAVAILCVDSTRPDEFTDDDQRLLETLAVHVGLALERLRHEEELEIIARFPSENPNPVFRLNEKGTILYANQASNALLEKWGCKVGDISPKFLQDLVAELRNHQIIKIVDVEVGERVYAIQMVPLLASGYVNAYGRDITVRKRAEEEARAASLYARSLIEASLDPLVTISEKGLITDVNRATELVTEFSREQLIGSDFSSYFTDPKKAKEAYIEGFAKGFLKDYPLAIRSESGKVTEVLYNATVFRDETGKVRGVLATARDITERKHAEETLKKSEKRFREAMEAANDGLWDRDVETGEAYFSPAYYRMLGYEPGEFPTSTRFWLDQIHPDDRAQAFKVTEDCIENRVSNFEVEFRMRTKSGGWKWILGRGRASARDANWRALRMIGTHQDITERKQMEHELRRYSENLEQLVSERTKKLTESEERYRQLLESMSEHIAVLDDEFRYVLANDALTRSIKIPREQLRGKKLTEIFPGVEKSVFFEAGQRVMKSRSSTSVVDAHRFEDGRAGWYECHIYPVPEGIMYVANDITERKRMEEALLKSERMATIGELAAMVGHDLRNPLQGIAGAAYNIRRHLRNAPDPSTKEMLAVIDNGVQYANGIINDLLEFSKEMQLQPVPTTPKSIVRQTMTDLRIPNNITIEDTTADTPEILADEPKLRRVLTNLIENAIDAMPEGGELSISSVNTQQGVSILLSDTGFGIPQNMIEKIWTPLHTTKAKGIGLGLPICRRIMEAHGGSISVESSVGKGTTFTLKLPIQPVQAEVKHYD